MAFFNVPPTIQNKFVQPFAIISSSLLIIIFIYHTITSRINYVQHSQSASKFSLILSFTLFFIAFSLSIWCITNLFAQSKQLCNLSQFIGVPFYILFKLNLYLILIHRLHLIFHYTYPAKKLKIWAFIITFWCVINIISLNIFCKNTFNENAYPKCHLIQNKFVFITTFSIGLLDIISGVINSFLFIKPVIKLSKVIKDEQSKEMLIVAAKQCFLSLIAIFSTLICLICIFLFGMFAVFLFTDMILSILSVILMYKWNAFITKKICGCCFGFSTPPNCKEPNNLTVTVVDTKTKTVNNDINMDNSSKKESVKNLASLSLSLIN